MKNAVLTALAGVAAGVAISSIAGAQEANKPANIPGQPQIFTYQQANVKFADMEGDLKRYGAEGWELVTVLNVGAGRTGIAVFKKLQ